MSSTPAIGILQRGVEVKVSFIQKTHGAQKSHMTSLNLWSRDSQQELVPPSQAKKPITKSPLTPTKLHYVAMTELVTSPHFPLHRFPRSLGDNN